MLSRRAWLALVATAATRTARADAPHLVPREIEVPGAGGFGKKCLVLRPSRVDENTTLPLLILFHGLGETVSESLGIHAWADKYGLLDAYARLAAPPVVRTLPNKRYLSDDRLKEINDQLAREPLTDVCIVCPFTPNPFKKDPSAPLLDAYAHYIESALLPAVHANTRVTNWSRCTGVDGVSLGGYVSLEIFLRKPDLFGVVGTMQGAFGKQLAEVYARRIAEMFVRFSPPRIHVTTSTFDPFREASELFARRLNERDIYVKLTVPEGPHDQTFLKEVGTLETLLFQAHNLQFPKPK